MPPTDERGNMPEPAPEVVMDANGAYWRRYPGHLSMCPVSTDNEPLAEPVFSYVPVAALGRFLFDYEMDRLPPDKRTSWDELEDWKRESWQAEALEYAPTARTDA